VTAATTEGRPFDALSREEKPDESALDTNTVVRFGVVKIKISMAKTRISLTPDLSGEQIARKCDSQMVGSSSCPGKGANSAVVEAGEEDK
jgi:hypothetical protein